MRYSDSSIRLVVTGNREAPAAKNAKWAWPLTVLLLTAIVLSISAWIDPSLASMADLCHTQAQAVCVWGP
jgi:hypothetical protein